MLNYCTEILFKIVITSIWYALWRSSHSGRHRHHPNGVHAAFFFVFFLREKYAFERIIQCGGLVQITILGMVAMSNEGAPLN